MTRPRLEVAEVFRRLWRCLPRPLRRHALARATPRPARHRRLPHGGPGRARRGVRPVRASAGSPTTRAATATAPSARPPPRRSGWRPGSGVAARRVLSRRLHAPGGARPDRLAEPAGGLRPAVPGRRRDLAADRRRSRSTSGPRSASWPSCTPGARTSQHHPHVHCVVPGGGLSPDGSRWVACRPGFFLPVRVLSRVFRGKFLALLRAAFEQGQALLPREARRAGRPGRVPAPARRQRQDRVGRLRQAAVRRPGAGAEVPGPVHPPGGDQQPAGWSPWRTARSRSAGRTTRTGESRRR